MLSEREQPTGAALLAAVIRDVRSYRWLVAVVVLVAMAGAVVATVTAPTSWTGRSSLVVSSPDRSPDQDAVLVQGYVDFFDDEAYQSQLLSEASLSGSIDLEARSAAASPILVIEATADSADLAQEASAGVAEVFAADINAVRDEERAAIVSQLQTRMDARIRAEGPEASSVATLRSELLRVESDRTDELQELQLEAGVTADSPAPVPNLLLGLAGGLLLGVAAAAGTGAVVRRRGGR